MGHVYALAGPSGVGKTTFLQRLFKNPQSDLKLLTRATGRKPRPGEKAGFDYDYYTEQGFLQKIASNDFVHVEQFGDSFYGIEASPIKEAIASSSDAMIMSGIYGATRLQEIFGANVSVVFMFTGSRRALLSPAFLDLNSPEILELMRRLREKTAKGIVRIPASEIDGYISARLALDLVSLAYVNGRIRSGANLLVLENFRDKMDETLLQFADFRRVTSRVTIDIRSRRNVCFVLMPFREELTPIYDDHIVPVVRRLGLECLRADRIFSTGVIIDEVLDQVRNARIVISDLTQANPNVFYETGFCHALRKDVILLTQDATVPSDLQHVRQIRYKYTLHGMVNFAEALTNTIKSILET